MPIAIVYGSTTGKTRAVALRLQGLLPDSVALNVAELSPTDLAGFGVVVLGVSTWGTGALQDDWARQLDRIPAESFAGKALAFYGLGDRIAFADTFCSAVELLRARYSPVARAVFEPSLLLDDDNDPEDTPALVAQWAQRLKAEGLGDR